MERRQEGDEPRVDSNHEVPLGLHQSSKSLHPVRTSWGITSHTWIKLKSCVRDGGDHDSMHLRDQLLPTIIRRENFHSQRSTAWVQEKHRDSFSWISTTGSRNSLDLPEVFFPRSLRRKTMPWENQGRLQSIVPESIVSWVGTHD